MNIINIILNKISNYKFKKEWRKLNKHNTTTISRKIKMNLVSVGKYTYGNLDILNFGNSEKLIIGNFCSIAPNVVFLLNSDHYTDRISTFPFKVKCLKNVEYEGISKGDIIVEDDVWIGYGSIILSGVKIGKGAIVAAGSVVTKNIPPYSISAGNPAKVKKFRFNQDIIDELIKNTDYSKLTYKDIENNIDLLYKKIEKKEDLENWVVENEYK